MRTIATLCSIALVWLLGGLAVHSVLVADQLKREAAHQAMDVAQEWVAEHGGNGLMNCEVSWPPVTCVWRVADTSSPPEPEAVAWPLRFTTLRCDTFRCTMIDVVTRK